MEEAWIEIGDEGSFSFGGNPGRSPVNLFADSSALAKRYIADEKCDRTLTLPA